jgi:O-antigen biosynthesis protein
MLLSAFTPTHKPKFLIDLWDTIKIQEGNWEWVIVYNGSHAKRNFSNFSAKIVDPRVRHLIFQDVTEKKIGTLKRWACGQCEGAILIEVDHDDLLSEDCFSELEQAFSDPEVGFAYSDFCEFYDETWESQIYGKNSGWETYEVPFEDKTLIAHKSFPPDARSVCQIEFAPNHVRAWRKDVYDKMGGHADLSAGDDHELVCRTYLETKMKHIQKPLYFYRRLKDQNNSYLKRYKEIRIQEAANRNKYIYKLMERWCELNDLKKIDLGAAHGKPEGFLGVDIIEGATDFTCDVTEGLPFDDNSVGLIRAVDFMEHIPDKIKLINEIYRVLAPGGWLMSITPSTDGRGAFQDPTHVAFYNQNSFWYYTKKSSQKFVDGLDCRFQAARLFTSHPSKWHEQHKISYVYADLVAIKEGYRPPGIVEI